MIVGDKLEIARRISQAQCTINSDMDIGDILRYPYIPTSSYLGLKSHQIEHAQRLLHVLRVKGKAGDTSAPGSGKTYVAAYVAKELGLPVLVFTALAVKKICYDVIHTMAGNPVVTVTNYNMALAPHSDTITKWYDTREEYTNTATVCPWITKKKMQIKKVNAHDPNIDTKNVVEFEWKLPYKCFIIFDEEHVGKNIHTQTFAFIKGAMEDAKRMGHKILYISATPTEKRENLKSILYFLGIISKPDMNSVKAYFQREIGSHETIDIHHYLYAIHPDSAERSTGCLSYMPKAELPPGIVNDVKPMTYPMDEETTRKIAQKSATILAIKKHLRDRIYDGSLGSLNENIHFIENYKVAKAQELVIKGLEGDFPVEDNEGTILKGFKRVCVFVNYKDALHNLRSGIESKGYKVSVMHGDQKSEESDDNKLEYMTGKSRVMISTIKKGGMSLSLHDTKGDMETLVIIMPPTSATALDQCLGRHFRTDIMSSVVQRILFTAGDKVEESIRDGLSKKLNENHLFLTGQGADFELYDLVPMEDVA